MNRIVVAFAITALGASCSGSVDAVNNPLGPLGSTCPSSLAEKLGRPPRFLIGLGNEPQDSTTYSLGVTLDIHYVYLSRGWTGWGDKKSDYVVRHLDAGRTYGVVPMFTFYESADQGDGALTEFTDATYMRDTYWKNIRQMFMDIGDFREDPNDPTSNRLPAIVHFEPDFWGYVEQCTSNAHPGGVSCTNTATHTDDPTIFPALVDSECANAHLPNNAAGLAQCMVWLRNKLAPNAIVGLHASTFGAHIGTSSDPVRVAKFLIGLGAEIDFIAVETLDRDAGCFEARGPNCNPSGRSGNFYWNENDFSEHLAWAKAIHDTTTLPLLWWQTPLGAPSDQPGGTPQHYRDNRVQYIFAHPDKFVAAGGVGAVFGRGEPNQTNATTDGGQFKNAVKAYFASPTPLPDPGSCD